MAEPTAKDRQCHNDYAHHKLSGKGACRVISRSISAYLVQAWDVRDSCKHN
jgi:hypothetical protein